MNIEHGDIVTIEGSDTLWVVQGVEKDLVSVIDERMGIIELDGIPLSEVTGVLEVAETA